MLKLNEIKGGYSVIEYYGQDKEIVIPDEQDGLPIVEIAKNAFSNQLLTKVVLPKGLKIIRSSAFSQCGLLESIEFPDGLVNIENYAFSGCASLQEITLPESVIFIDEYAFLGCYSLTKLTALNRDIRFEKSTFNMCNKLDDVSFFLWERFPIEKQKYFMLKKYCDWDILDCDERNSIVEYVVQNDDLVYNTFVSEYEFVTDLLFDIGVKISLFNVKKILEHTIKNERTKLTATLLDYQNKNFTKDELEAFDDNKSLVELGMELPTLEQLKEKWFIIENENRITILGYKGKYHSETIPISTIDGTQITNITASTLTNYKALLHIVIDAQIKSIADRCFRDSKNLTSIVLPNTVTHIKKQAFSGCSNLEEITIPESVTIIDENAFKDCVNLAKITLPPNLQRIEKFAFHGCESLETITIPPTVKIIGHMTFRNCKNLKTVILEKDNETNINTSTFDSWTNIIN